MIYLLLFYRCVNDCFISSRTSRDAVYGGKQKRRRRRRGEGGGGGGGGGGKRGEENEIFIFSFILL